MWIRRSAIPPVPRYARVPESAVAAIESAFGGADERAQRLATEGFERFRIRQAALSEYFGRELSPSRDEKALALGYMLSIAVFGAFEEHAGAGLRSLDADAVAAADAAIGADEQLRRADPVDALDSEDIIAIDQPALVAFVNEHIGRTIERYADSIDVDDVAAVFRALLVQILALSSAVPAPPGFADAAHEGPMA